MISCALFHWRTVIVNRITHLYWQHRVEAFEYPKGTVVCEAFCYYKWSTPKDWPTVPDLLRAANYQMLTAGWDGSRFGDLGNDGAGLIIPEIRRYSTNLVDQDAALLFVGEQRSSGSTHRMILPASPSITKPRPNKEPSSACCRMKGRLRFRS